MASCAAAHWSAAASKDASRYRKPLELDALDKYGKAGRAVDVLPVFFWADRDQDWPLKAEDPAKQWMPQMCFAFRCGTHKQLQKLIGEGFLMFPISQPY